MITKNLKSFIIVYFCFLLSACYTVPPNPANPPDPFQHLNRDGTRFNHKIDEAVIKPAAKVYNAVIPYEVRHSLSNFFANLDELPTIGNDILQTNVQWALSDTWRFIVNTTVGIGGLFDVAEHIGLQPHDNDFALTLNQWGLYSAYFVVPFVGPRTVASAAAIPIDDYATIQHYYFSIPERVPLIMLYGLNVRAGLLNTQKMASGLILDRYLFYRSAYFQHRTHLLQINERGPYFDLEQAENK